MSANNFGPRGVTSRNFFTWPAWECRYNFLDAYTRNTWEGQKHPKFDANLDNFRIWSQISTDGTNYDVDKRRMALSTTVPRTFDGKDSVNVGPLITKFTCLISTHPKSTVRVTSDNFGLWSRMYLKRIDIFTSGKWHYQLRSMWRSTNKICWTMVH